MQNTMYSAITNSPITTLSESIDSSQDTIKLTDISVLNNIKPGLLTIGYDINAETVLYTDISGSQLTGCTRGFQGTAKAWEAGIPAGRMFTAYDHNSFKDNIEDLDSNKDGSFKIKSAFYTSGTDILSVVIAPGSGETISGTTINTITKVSDTTFTISSPSASTTYTIYLKNDDNFDKSTDTSQAIGSLLIGTVSTNADKSVSTIVDKRPLVSGVGKVVAKHLADYASKFPNNAGAHNSLYRGKYLGSSVTAGQYATILDGTFEDLYIGDYWTIGGVNYIIAAFNYYRRKGDTDTTVNHVTLVPDANLYAHVMNDTNITTGGYTGSKMYTEGLEQAKTTITSAFSGHVLNHRKLLSNATTEGKASGWAWVNSEIDLMNEVMVYGSTVWGESTIGGSGYNIGEGLSQLPFFALRPDMISNRQTFWLRDVVSASFFAHVGTHGFAHYYYASTAYGVRPVFSIS